MSRKYVIIDAGEVGSIDFAKVCETGAETLRYSLDETQTFVKFEGEVPSFLEGKTQHSQDEILTILGGEDWSPPTVTE